jgi:hypothetical protein
MDIQPQLKALQLALLLAFTSCGPNPSVPNPVESQVATLPKVYIKLSQVNGVDESQVRKDSVYILKDNYFEIGLFSYDEGKFYLAKRDLVEPKSIQNFYAEFIFITNEDGSDYKFSNSTDFLNFMADCGYEMVDQKKFDFRTDYTFKKVNS